jgi:hypothetical protein
MQKLITVNIDDDNDDDLGVTEHLNNYLEEGWKVVSVTPLVGTYGFQGADDERVGALGWMAVLLDKS